MNAKLPAELREQLQANQDAQGYALEDEQTHKIWIVIDEQTHRRAMQALREKEDRESIQRGIDDMEAGRVVPLEEVDARIRSELGLPVRQ